MRRYVLPGLVVCAAGALIALLAFGVARQGNDTSIEIRRHYDRSLPKLTLRGSELNQVWTNLLANAIEALGGAGVIEIDTERDGACARVDIIDDGPGIPAEIRDRVFDPFFTTKDVGEGTGLGLDTARRIVTERLGGSIDFDSVPGRTAFHIWLPLPSDPHTAER